jgi:acetyl-CoA acetyltransferase
MLITSSKSSDACRSTMARTCSAQLRNYHNEKPQYGDFMFPKLFARIAQIYRERYGVTEEQLALVVP